VSAYPSALGVLPPGKRPEPLPLRIAQPEEACSPLEGADYAGAARAPCARSKVHSSLSQSSGLGLL
jgi:hypothetical protein